MRPTVIKGIVSMIASTVTIRNHAPSSDRGQESIALPWQVAPCTIVVPQCRSEADFARGQYVSVRFFDTGGRALTYVLWQDRGAGTGRVRYGERAVYSGCAPVLARDYGGSDDDRIDGGESIIVVDPRLWVILYPIGSGAATGRV